MKHITRRLLFALLGFACFSHAFAATYFVNSNGGSDSYTGAVPAATGGTAGPWQTLARLAIATLAPNDTVYLACGGVWAETLQIRSSGAVNVPITIAAGPGACSAPPLIDGALTIPAQQWVQHSGAIYRAKLPVDLISNPNPGASLSGWYQWSATADAVTAVDNACPGQATPCMAFTSGTSSSIAISNNFALAGGADYTAGVQLRATLGTRIKVVLRRGGPTYENLAPEQWITAAGAWQSVGFIFRAGTSVPNARMDIEVPGTRIRVNLREAHMLRALPGGNVLATYVDGLQVRRAHHPNFGQGGNADSPYATIASAGGKTTVDATGMALPAGAVLTPGLGVTMRTINWAIEERTVAAVSGSRMTLSAPTEYDTQPGYGFYLTGALWMLDSPGEWFYDSAASILYVWMPDGAAPGNRVSASGLALGADLSVKSNVNLQGIAIRHVGAGVSLKGSAAATLSGVSIADIADLGISAENCAQCSVQGSSVSRTGRDAISVPGSLATGFSLTDSNVSESGASTRTDNWRTLPRPANAAVYSIGAGTSILRSTVSVTGNLGVFIGPGSTVANNYVSRTCLTLNDCGGIYANSLGHNATIRGNLVENVVGSLAGVPGSLQSQAVGIYLDDGSTNSLVTGNTVTGADYGIQLHNANNDVVSNNVLFGNRRYQLWFQEQTRVVRGSGDIFGNTINANFLVPTAGGPALYLESEIGATAAFASFSANHYSGLLSPLLIGERTPSAGSSYTVSQWQAAGRESGALVTQPVGYAPFLAGATNLVPNGNMASGMTNWTWWNQTAPNSSVALLPCGFGPCLRLAAGGSPTILSSPNFSVTAGQWYRVSFDAATSQGGQPINAVVRRGGGGSAGYEYLMPAAESFSGSTVWQRYSFAFQANKTVIAGNPATQELGARVDFERNQPGTTLTVAKLEMVTLTPAQAALQIKLLLNRGSSIASVDCASLGVAVALCNSFVYMGDDSPVSWPVSVNPLSGIPVYTRDTSLTDSDGDGIADQQDACPNTPAGQAVNARGCPFGQ